MVDATFALNLVETVGILVGVTIAIIEIRKSREDRRNQVADQFLEYSKSQEYMEHWISFLRNMEFSTYEEWSEKYSPYVNPEAAVHWYTLHFYIDTIGKRVIDGMIDLDLALSNMPASMVIGIWEKSQPIFEEWKKRYNMPTWVPGLEYLYNEMKKIYPDMSFAPNPQRQRLMQR